MVGGGKTSRETGRRAGPQTSAAYSALLSAADRVRARFEAVCAPFNITGQQYNVLRILRGAGAEGLPTLTVAERMIERAPGVTRMVDRLEAKGLVERETRADDRRRVHCRVTPKGLELLKSLDAPVEEFNAAAFRGLSKEELAQLVALLGKVREGNE